MVKDEAPTSSHHVSPVRAKFNRVTGHTNATSKNMHLHGLAREVGRGFGAGEVSGGWGRCSGVSEVSSAARFGVLELVVSSVSLTTFLSFGMTSAIYFGRIFTELRQGDGGRTLRRGGKEKMEGLKVVM